MNVHLQLCGLVIVFFLLLLYKSHRTLDLTGEKVFLRMLLLVALCISLDALSVVGIFCRAILPIWLVKGICKAYLISMIWVGWVNFCYVTLDLNSTPQNHMSLVRTMKLVTVVESIIVACLPISIYDQGSQVYTYGPAVVITYVFTLSYIVFMATVATYIKKKKNSRRGSAVLMVVGLWVGAAAIQALHNEFLLVGFSMAVGVMVLYTVMENPDANIDRQLGCYNAYALHKYLGVLMDSNTVFSVMDLSILDLKALEERGIDVELAAKTIIDSLDKKNNIMLFKNMGTALLAVSDSQEELNKLATFIMGMVAGYKDGPSNVRIFTVGNAQQFETTNGLLRFLTFVRSQSGVMSNTEFGVSDALIRQYNEAQEVEKEIDLALAEDRVEVFLQPIHRASTNKPVSAEALVRIRKPDGGYLSPGVFIPVAESTGQIVPLGERILDRVCKFIKESNIRELGISPIHVNLSAVQCDDPQLASRLDSIVRKYEIDPLCINFEITETAVSSAKEVLLKNMYDLIERGYRFALDDFGKGESNLMYIVEMPVDLLKLDMDMTRAYFNNNKARIVVGGVSEMAHELRLPIVAEGVESWEQVEGIKKQGVQLLQGYYYSKPLPTSEFLDYIKGYGA